MRVFRAVTLCALAVCGCRTVARSTAESHASPLPELAVPRVTPPVIDGALDDATWTHAATIRGLGPCRGGTRLQGRIDQIPTTVRVAWDTNALYVAFECLDDHIDTDPVAKHDADLYLHDVCEVFLDPVGDGRQYTEIQVTPDGQTLDMIHLLTAAPEYTKTGRLTPAFSSRELWRFREWEAEGLRVACGRLQRDGATIGWTVEMAIPAAPVMRRRGLSTFVPGEIRANFARYDWQPVPATGKRDLLPMYWTPVESGCPHISAGMMGRLLLASEAAP
jgi:hypothetical protein